MQDLRTVRKWKLEKRASFLVLSFLFFFGALAFFFFKTSTVSEGIAAHTQRIIENDLNRSTMVYTIADELHHAASAEKDLLLGSPASGTAAQDALFHSLDKVQTNVDWLVGHVRIPERIILIHKIDDDSRAYRHLADSLVENIEKGNRDESLRISSQDMQPLRDKIHSTLFAMIASYRADIDEHRERMSQEGDSLQISLILLAFLTIPLACVIAWFGVR